MMKTISSNATTNAAIDITFTQIGHVEAVSGTVFVVRSDGSPSKAKAGDPVFEGDEFLTANDGSIGVEISDGTVFTMAENSNIRLDLISFDDVSHDGFIQLNVFEGVFTFLSGTVAMYAGNVGFSQSLDTVIEAARQLDDITFVINGDGAARERLEHQADGLPNVRFVGYQAPDRLAEVLAAADIHLVPLRAGLGSVSVPSKTYTALAAARPVIAAVDPGTAIDRLVTDTACGICVAPDDTEALVGALRELAGDPERQRRLGESGRAWAVDHASPAAVGEAYERVLSRRPVNPRSSR